MGAHYNFKQFFQSSLRFCFFALMPHALRIFATIVWTASALSAYALQSDRDQPMHIDADAMHYDDRQQLSTFSGNVIVTKGSIVLRGHTLQVRQSDDGNQVGTMTAAPGQRAFFSQQRDVSAGSAAQHVEGEGEHITYNSHTGMAELTGRAQLRRYEAGRLSDDITGSVLRYNSHTEVFTADGAAQTGQASATPGNTGRVRAVITPRSTQKPLSGQVEPKAAP